MNMVQAYYAGQEIVRDLGVAWHEASLDGRVTLNELIEAIAKAVRKSKCGTMTIAEVDPNDSSMGKAFAGFGILSTAITGILSLVKGDPR